MWDQIVVYFDHAKTRSFDDFGDAYFLKSPIENAPSFFAKEGEVSASILGRPASLLDSVEVPFESIKDESAFYIQSNLDELQNGYSVFIKDRLSNKTEQLQSGESFEFKHDSGINSPRFMVYYTLNPNLVNHLIREEGNVVSRATEAGVEIQSFDISGIADIYVHDIMGRTLLQDRFNMQADESYNLEFESSNQVLMLK